MATVQAVVQEVWREILARLFALDVADTHAEIALFKIGESSFLNIPPKDPIAPEPALRDLYSEGTPLTGGGTCEFTNGSATVTGSGTSFLADVNAGDWIKPGPLPSAFVNSAGVPGSEEDGWGQVASVDNDLQITLSAPYIGTTHLLAEGRECHRAQSSSGVASIDPPLCFRKALTALDVLFSSGVPAITEITAIVGAAEANANQLGGAPEFFELGVFDLNGVMLLHMTFPLEQKTPIIQLNHVLELIF